MPRFLVSIDLWIFSCILRVTTRLTELVTFFKPLEAMIVGNPLVASNIGAYRKLIQDGETILLFTPGEIDTLSAAPNRSLVDQMEW
jgi:glycosyltransferase involved in cell wall biosynthesis